MAWRSQSAVPVDLAELDAVPGDGQGGEPPAGSVDHPYLAGVTNQHDFAGGLGGEPGEGVQVHSRRH